LPKMGSRNATPLSWMRMWKVAGFGSMWGGIFLRTITEPCRFQPLRTNENHERALSRATGCFARASQGRGDPGV
jgi:hypothetical protein